MSQNDDPFQEEDVQKPEKENDLSESFDAEMTSDEDDDVIDLLNASEEPDGEEIFELKETVDEMSVPDEEEDVIELTREADSVDEDEEIVELADEAEIDSGGEEDIVELADETEIDAGDDEHIVELAADQATDQAVIDVDEDKQILELIDDIQSTLDETKETEPADSADDADQTPSMNDTGDAIDQEEAREESILLGDEETVETDDLSDSESEFVDHLGLDLTAEFSKEMFSGNSEASALLTEKIEKAVNRVIHRMLSDENSPLVQAINKAAKKEIE